MSSEAIVLFLQFHSVAFFAMLLTIFSWKPVNNLKKKVNKWKNEIGTNFRIIYKKYAPVKCSYWFQCWPQAKMLGLLSVVRHLFDCQWNDSSLTRSQDSYAIWSFWQFWHFFCFFENFWQLLSISYNNMK